MSPYHPVYPVHTNASAAMGEQTSKTRSAETEIILKQKIKNLVRLVEAGATSYHCPSNVKKNTVSMEKKHEQTYLVGGFNPSNWLLHGSR